MSLESQEKIRRLEKQLSELTRRVGLLEKARADGLEDYLDSHFPLIVPKIPEDLEPPRPRPRARLGRRRA